MATPADLRLLELLEKWLTSLELHAQYAALDDLSYSQVQSWPEHDRPTRWIIDLAKEKTLALRGQVQERIAGGDAKFSDSLELMTFLANLIGSEHIERYIPLADPAAATGTRKMPKVNGSAPPAPPEPARAARSERAERKPAAGEVKAAAARTPSRSSPTYDHSGAAAAVYNRNGAPPATAYDRSVPPAAAHALVIDDAARLVRAGRKWYELAEIIAAMADRPQLTDVRRILKDSKDAIDSKAGRG
jgi:hypothetical protein